MPKVSFDFSGHVASTEVVIAYDPVTNRNIPVGSWTDQQLADALNNGEVVISLGDHLYGPGYEKNIINQTNYKPG